MPGFLAFFSGIRGKLLGLLLLSLALSFALVALAVGFFFTEFHASATRARFQDVVVKLRLDERQRLASYHSEVRSIAQDPDIVASLNLISQYGGVGEQGVTFESERQKLAAELRRLSMQPLDTHLALLDERGALISVLSISADGVTEAYVTRVDGEQRLRVRRPGKSEDWRDEPVPQVLAALPSVGASELESVWYRGSNGLRVAVGAAVIKRVGDARPQRVGRVVLVHEYTGAFVEALARRMGVEFAVVVGRDKLPAGILGSAAGAIDVPLLFADEASEPSGWRVDHERFIEARAIALSDGDHAYLLFSSSREQARSQLKGTLTTIFLVLLVAMAAVLVLGHWLAKRWISNPARELVSAIDMVRRGDYAGLRTLGPAPDEFGIMSGALVDMADTIHEREQENALARSELRQSEERLRQVMAATGEGIWDIDIASDRVTHNGQWCRLLGLGDDYLVHSNSLFEELLHPEDRSRVMALLRDCLEGRDSFRSEHRMLRPDGSTIWVLDRGAVTERDVDGHPLRMVGSIADVTARRQAQESLQRLNAELEDRVRERTAELIAAKEAAEDATRVKSEFLANMSHEIRTPINAVLGMLYLALRGDMPESQRNQLVKAQTSALSLLGIINEILDLSKIEAGKLKLERVAFGFDSAIERVTDVISTQAEAKGLQFLIRYDKAIPETVIGDPLRIGQVLINLCGNAVKFTEQGQVELSFKVEELRGSSLVLHVCVKDSGIGMSAAQQANLFEKFSQADQSTTRRFGGTGLGLAISKRLVEMMGGRIWLESSQPGEGTEICFTVPLGVAADEGARRTGPRSGARLQGVRALVVDNNESARQILSDMLRDFGLTVDVRPDLPSALERLSSASTVPACRLVLMDWHLQGSDGAEAVRALRGAGDASVIVLAAGEHDEVQRAAAQAGATACLHKPVSPSTLLDTVLNALGLGKAVHDAAPSGEAPALSSPHALAGMRLLLVEDNSINREFARELLLTADIEVDEAIDGLEAVQRAQERQYDFVLMDVHMPVLDGLEATRQIRALAQAPGGERFAHLPIIAMTALAMSQDVDKSLEAGMNEHITKPIDPELLFTTLTRMAPGRRRAGRTQDEGSKDLMPKLLAMHSLDARGGILRIGNKAEAYRAQLLRFVEHYARAVDEIMRLLAEQGTVEAEAYCHGLKGVAGNIGATQLHEKVSAVDRALKEGRVPTPELMAETERRLRAVIDDIARLSR